MGTMGAVDVDAAVSLAAAALCEVADRDWSVPAVGLEWSCHDTVVHLAQDFAGYAAQVAGRVTDGYVPFEVVPEPGTGPDGLVRLVEATGGLLAAAVSRAPRELRAWHPYGCAGGDGFAAMGVVEALLHTRDVVAALGLPHWRPPGQVCADALERLFPQAPRDSDPWRTLLWATGRGGLDGLPRLGAWRWYADPVRSAGLVLCELSPGFAADLHRGGEGGFAWAEGGPEEGTRFAGGLVEEAYGAGAYRPGWGVYVMVRASDGRAVGGIGFHAAPDAEGAVEIGYDVVESARGRDHATEALRALAAWAFRHPEARVLRATVEHGNAASHTVVGRAGFRPVGSAGGNVHYELRRGGLRTG
ncbi:GNAT family N-acetyltransferase [Streptomyces sp. DH12]|uniref:GNAT family N-acetyltransferase n=1 Tax=Streptomyces sp. DH12 TaxID=2857010 RepID=UPI001E49DDA9|nr:GNAT family N-acetyltransferase [Streptomyces sp. DH12]